MNEQLRKYINSKIQLNDEEFSLIENAFRQKELKKGEHFIKVGETCRELAFFYKGYFRFYFW